MHKPSIPLSVVCRIRRCLLSGLFLATLPLQVFASDFFVDGDSGNDTNDGLSLATAKSTIGAAMSLVDGDDRVLVAPETYNERVKFPQGVTEIQLLAITAAGILDTAGADDHIIDGTGLGVGAADDALIHIPLVNGSTGPFGMVIDGFTLQNNTVNNSVAAGITSHTDDIDIRNTVIEDNINQQVFGTGGIYVFKALANFPSGGTFSKLIVRNNTAGSIGGIHLEGAAGSSAVYQITLVNSLIVDNQVVGTGSSSTAGAMFVIYPGSARIVNSTIAYNHVQNAPSGPRVDGLSMVGFSGFELGQININNSILWHPSGDDAFLGSNGSFSKSNTDFNDSDDLTGATASISSDPQFADQPDGDYHIGGTSVCVNAGNNALFGTPSDDLDGVSRTGNVDCGAFEAVLAPNITVTPSPFDFEQVFVGNTPVQDIIVSNTGTASLDIGMAASSNALASPFTITADTCSNTSVPPSGSCSLTVEFAPASVSNFTDSFDIPSNDADEAAVVITLSGTGVTEPEIDVSPTSLGFGNVLVGASDNLDSTVSNSGNANLTVSSVVLGGADASHFSLSDDCTTVAPAGNCAVTATFTPTTSGLKNATITINSDDADAPSVVVALSGTGVPVQYSIGGTVTGLTGSGLVLQNNGGDDLAIAAAGNFTFVTPLDDLSAYAVTVLDQPTSPDQTCTVSNGTGTLAGAAISNVGVSCTTPPPPAEDTPAASTEPDIIGTVPVANAGHDITMISEDREVEITLDASGSQDAESGLEFDWYNGNANIASGPFPTLTLANGTSHSISLRVTDTDGNDDYDIVVINLLFPDDTIPSDPPDGPIPEAVRLISAGNSRDAEIRLGAYSNTGELAYGNDFTSGDFVTILGQVTPDPVDVGVNGELFAAMLSIVAGKASFSFLNVDGTFEIWDQTLPDLGAAVVVSPLEENHELKVFEGNLQAGTHKVTFAYQAQGGPLVYMKPITIRVMD